MLLFVYGGILLLTALLIWQLARMAGLPLPWRQEPLKRLQRLGGGSWLLIGAALCGLLSFSLLHTPRAVREAAAVLETASRLEGDRLKQLGSIDRLRQMIVEVERKNSARWFPGLALDQGRETEEALKKRYGALFAQGVLASFDSSLKAGISALTPEAGDELRAAYLLYLSRRVNLIKARLSGRRPDRPDLPLPVSYPLGLLEMAGRGSGSNEQFDRAYLAYLAWRSGPGAAEKELQLLQSLLKQVVAVKGGDLDWLLGVVNQKEGKLLITMHDFWGGSGSVPGAPVILPAFTRGGKEQVNRLLAELLAAHPEPVSLEKQRADFEKRYCSACFASWQRFAEFFPKGEGCLAGGREWRKVAAVMATERGPYLSFFRRAANELEPFRSRGEPSWLTQLRHFQMLKNATPAVPAGTVTEYGAKVALKPGVVDVADGGEPQGGPRNAVQQYVSSIAQVAPVAQSTILAHQAALQLFNPDSHRRDTPLQRAATMAQKVTGTLSGGNSDRLFSRLLAGPVAFYATFVTRESACVLQNEWEEKVLKELRGASGPQSLRHLAGKDGAVWSFVSGSVDPFLGWDAGRGYYPKSAPGGEIPFRPEFSSFLAKSAGVRSALAAPVVKRQTLTVNGLPTDANSEALIKPQRTRLELLCDGGTQTIENRNYPVSTTFHWSPRSCKDVVLQIEVGDLMLTRSYHGAQAVPQFLRDFPGGRRTFHPGEFPEQKQALEEMGIRFIRVNYQLSGAQDIPSGPPPVPLPGPVPAKIADCWDDRVR